MQNGVGRFRCVISAGETSARIAYFALLVEGILNGAPEEDEPDFKKAFALYRYSAVPARVMTGQMTS